MPKRITDLARLKKRFGVDNRRLGTLGQSLRVLEVG